ncbi:WecB/TagA/CpsF family glycosyltransferase [Rhizobium sp. RCAM05350]|nr:WecB/TagA/CpsF family glycosyltransferase [Rhizobium sp. RCAM05350]
MNVFPGTSIIASQRMILDMPVCDFGWADAFAFADEIASLPIGQTVISFLNAHNANLMMHDPEYRAVLSRHIVLPDGHGVDLASVLFHGKTFPANLNGTDFVPALMTYMTTPRRIAMVGARPDVLKRCRKFPETRAMARVHRRFRRLFRPGAIRRGHGQGSLR